MYADEPEPYEVARSFGLGEPTGELEPLRAARGVPMSWRLETSTGPYMLKRVRDDIPDWWIPYAERAMEFERRALGAGIAMPRPIEPVVESFGSLVTIDEGGPVRVYEWIDGRPLGRHDDIAAWLGRTIATLNSIGPEPSAALAAEDLGGYGLHAREEWESWFEEAQSARLRIGNLGMENLEGIMKATDFVLEALRSVDDFVITHRDIEPWNLLVTEGGPVLVDFDGVGKDSAWLVAAWAAVAYGMHERSEPDEKRVQAVVRGYIDGGGRVACDGPWSLGRRVSLRLVRLALNVWLALGHRPSAEVVRADALRRAEEKLPSFPGPLLDDVARWAELLTP